MAPPVAGSLPSWFEADSIFSHKKRWYFGSLDGLHVGPYASKETAETKGLQVATRLRRFRTDGQKLRFVRELLRAEWPQILRDNGAQMDDAIIAEHIDLTPPPMRVRRGEPARTWFRSGRFFQVDGAWFIATREGIDVGPFETEAQAARNEQRLIHLLALTNSAEEAYRTIYEFKHGLGMENDLD